MRTQRYTFFLYYLLFITCYSFLPTKTYNFAANYPKSVICITMTIAIILTDDKKMASLARNNLKTNLEFTKTEKTLPYSRCT